METQYEGSFLKDNALLYPFTFRIEIENQSNSLIQLLTRHWKILEGLNKTQYVNGNGVVGKKHLYQSKRNSQVLIKLLTFFCIWGYEKRLYYDRFIIYQKFQRRNSTLQTLYPLFAQLKQRVIN